MFKGIFYAIKILKLGFKRQVIDSILNIQLNNLPNFQLSVVDQILHFLLVFRLQRHFVLITRPISFRLANRIIVHRRVKFRLANRIIVHRGVKSFLTLYKITVVCLHLKQGQNTSVCITMSFCTPTQNQLLQALSQFLFRNFQKKPPFQPKMHNTACTTELERLTLIFECTTGEQSQIVIQTGMF